MAINKIFFYKIYDKDGNYIATWGNDVTNIPNFSWSINGGLGELNIKLARKVTSFGETDDIRMGNEVRCYILDKESGASGQLIYSGYIAGYKLHVEGEEEYIEVKVLPYTVELNSIILKNADGRTTLTYYSEDPSEILKSILANYRIWGGRIWYTDQTIDSTSTAVTYEFKAYTCREAIDKVLQLAPAYWYWYIDPENNINFKKSNFEASDHQFILEKHIKSMSPYKNIEDLYNVVYFLGGGDPQLYKVYQRTSSIDEYGRREYKMQDERVTTAATAQIIAESFLDERDHPEAKVSIEIIDSNGSEEEGYDIESIRPGQTAVIQISDQEIKKSLWDVSIWDIDFWDVDVQYVLGVPMQIQKIDYKFDSAVVELSTRAPEVTKRIEDINRNLEIYRSKDAPDQPN